MGAGWLGHGRTGKSAKVGDLVICVDVAKRDATGGEVTFIGLVLDKSITISKIQVLGTGKIVYCPMDAMLPLERKLKEGNR